MGVCGEPSLLASFLARTSFVQLCGFFTACVGWLLCLFTTSAGQWRQWHIENTTTYATTVVWIGIWDVCYDSNTADADYYEKVCKPFDAEHLFLPKEIFVAQDLMSLCAVVETLALGLFFFAFWNIFKNDHKRGITITFFTIGGFLTLTSGSIVLIPVTWNMLAILNNEPIDFPDSFDLPSNPKHQNAGVAIYFGFVSAIFQIVSGLLFLGNKCFFIHKKVHPFDSEQESESSSGKDSDYCSRCGSSLIVATSGHYKSSCESNRDRKKEREHEAAFEIPMGPIPDQRVAHSSTKAFTVIGESPYF